MNSPNEKDLIRRNMLKTRVVLSDSEIKEKSNSILLKLTSLPEYTEARYIHTFVGSLPGEVNTIPLIESALSDEKEIMVPVIAKRLNPLSHSILRSLSDLERSTLGILQPSPEKIIPSHPSKSQMIIVPGVAFDRTGCRLGMGGGHYDGFLSEVQVLKVGLCYDFQVVDSVPTEKHDIRVNIIITESEIIRIAP